MPVGEVPAQPCVDCPRDNASDACHEAAVTRATRLIMVIFFFGSIFEFEYLIEICALTHKKYILCPLQKRGVDHLKILHHSIQI